MCLCVVFRLGGDWWKYTLAGHTNKIQVKCNFSKAVSALMHHSTLLYVYVCDLGWGDQWSECTLAGDSSKIQVQLFKSRFCWILPEDRSHERSQVGGRVAPLFLSYFSELTVHQNTATTCPYTHARLPTPCPTRTLIWIGDVCRLLTHVTF